LEVLYRTGAEPPKRYLTVWGWRLLVQKEFLRFRGRGCWSKRGLRFRGRGCSRDVPRTARYRRADIGPVSRQALYAASWASRDYGREYSRVPWQAGIRFTPELGYTRTSSSSLLFSSLEFSDTTIYEPEIRALLESAPHSCQAVVLRELCRYLGVLRSLGRREEGVGSQRDGRVPRPCQPES